MCILIKIFCIWRCEQGWQILFSLNNEWIQEFTYFHEDCCFINIHFWSQMISSLQLILKCVFLKKWHDSKKLLFFKFIIYWNMYPSWDVVLTYVPKEGNFILSHALHLFSSEGLTGINVLTSLIFTDVPSFLSNCKRCCIRESW